MKVKLIIFILSILTLLQTAVFTAFAADEKPSDEEIRREEFLLKQRLKPVLKDVLDKQYLGLVVNFNYVLIHDPIVSDKAKISRLRLPGFGTRITIASDPDDIAGYINKFMRYRSVTVLTQTRIPISLQESIARMIKQTESFDITSGRDKLNFMDIKGEIQKPVEIGPEEQALAEQKTPEELEAEAEEAEKKKVDDIVEKLDKDRKEKKERLARLFPDLETPLKPVDPRQEAESSKHLILSKKAYYNNDLNTALNEVIEAITINPYASKSYEMLGSIYYRLKWYNLALNNWEKALALDPDNSKLTKYIEKAKREL